MMTSAAAAAAALSLFIIPIDFWAVDQLFESQSHLSRVPKSKLLE